jgi:hypothetical protein
LAADSVRKKGTGFRCGIEIITNGPFEFGDAREHAATDSIAGDQAEEALDLVEPAPKSG